MCALGLPRSTLYYRPIPVRESMLRIMARTDALYSEDPCSGSRRMVGYLSRQMGSSSAATGLETSCSAWVYGRLTRNPAPRFQGIHLRACPALWISLQARAQLEAFSQP
jgi:hypothetical protein